MRGKGSYSCLAHTLMLAQTLINDCILFVCVSGRWPELFYSLETAVELEMLNGSATLRSRSAMARRE